MNTDDAQDLFDALGEGVPDRRPPTGDLLVAGHGALRRRRRTTLAGVVAGTVLAIGVGVAVQQVATSPAAVAPAGPSPSSGVDIQPGRWQLPSVLGYDEEQAKARLEQLGLVVTVKKTGIVGCGLGDGDAAGTTPYTGTYVGPGDAVMLSVAGFLENSGGIADCVDDRDPGRDLLRLARGGRAPAFAPTVTIVGGGDRLSLSAAEAADPASWEVCGVDACRNVLDALVARADRPSGVVSSIPGTAPYLSSLRAGGQWQQMCNRSLDEGHPPVVVDVKYGYDGPEGGCGILDVYRNGEGRIDAVELASYDTRIDISSLPVADVRGMEAGPAVAELASAGFGAEVVSVGECSLGDVVHDQDPLGSAPNGSRITINVCGPAAPSAPISESAEPAVCPAPIDLRTLVDAVNADPARQVSDGDAARSSPDPLAQVGYVAFAGTASGDDLERAGINTSGYPHPDADYTLVLFRGVTTQAFLRAYPIGGRLGEGASEEQATLRWVIVVLEGAKYAGRSMTSGTPDDGCLIGPS